MRRYILLNFIFLVFINNSYGQDKLTGKWIQKSIQIENLNQKSDTKEYLIFRSEGTVTIIGSIFRYHFRSSYTSNSEKTQMNMKRLRDSTVTYQGTFYLKGDSIYIDTPEFQRNYFFKLTDKQLVLIRNLRGELIKDKDLIMIEDYKKSGR